MIRKIVHYTDSLLTQERARLHLTDDKIVVAWYTNLSNRQSVVHSHPYYECILPVSGEVLYSANGELFTLHPGETILFPQEVYHTGKYDVGPDVSERLVIQFDGALWQNLAARLGLTGAQWDKNITIFRADAVAYWDLRGLFERMSMTSAMKPDCKTTVYEAQLTELLLIFKQIIEENLVEQPTATSLLVAKSVEYIRTHYQEPDLTVAQLADNSFVSRGHLSRAFKEYTMESVHSYLTNLRMQHCRQSIADGKSVLDACNESGFSDYSSFLKTFRKLYGITPTEYRAQLKKGQIEARY